MTTNDNSQKTHFGLSIHKSAIAKADALDHNIAKALPATIKEINGNQTAMTINFDVGGQIYTMPTPTIPHGMHRYYRIPYAVGDKGYTTPGSLSVTPASKLGPDVATFTKLSNLATQVFYPIADTMNFPAMINPGANEHTSPIGHYSHDDDNKALLKVHTSDGTSISGGGSTAGTPGPQKFHTKHDGSTEHTADTDHTSTVGGSNTQTADSHTQTAQTTHTITAPMGHNINAPTNVSGLLSANGGLNIPTGQPFSIPNLSVITAMLANLAVTTPKIANGAVTNTQMGSGAASANVGTLGADLNGTLPNPTVVGITHITNANTLPTYDSNALALAGGLVAGQLYKNTSVDTAGLNTVLCVVT